MEVIGVHLGLLSIPLSHFFWLLIKDAPHAPSKNCAFLGMGIGGGSEVLGTSMNPLLLSRLNEPVHLLAL